MSDDVLPPRPPDTPDAKQPDNEPPIFWGSVSLWMGFKTFVVAGLVEVVGLAAIIYGALNPNRQLGPAPLIVGLALFVASNLMLAYVVVSIRCQRYKINRRLIEREQGLLFKRVDALDLARVKDVQLSQSLLQRMLNIGTIEVFSSDKTDPAMLIEAIPDPRPVYEKLRDAVIEISQKRGIVNMGN